MVLPGVITGNWWRNTTVVIYGITSLNEQSIVGTVWHRKKWMHYQSIHSNITWRKGGNILYCFVIMTCILHVAQIVAPNLQHYLAQTGRIDTWWKTRQTYCEMRSWRYTDTACTSSSVVFRSLCLPLIRTWQLRLRSFLQNALSTEFYFPQHNVAEYLSLMTEYH